MQQINETGAREYFRANKWPAGLQNTVLKNMQKFPIRFMIIDDSGSMGASDGSRLVHSGNNST